MGDPNQPEDFHLRPRTTGLWWKVPLNLLYWIIIVASGLWLVIAFIVGWKLSKGDDNVGGFFFLGWGG